MRYPFAIEEDDKVAILRPDDPRLALELSDRAAEIEDVAERQQAFLSILHAQTYSYVGLLSLVGKPHRKLLDRNGWAIGHVRLGDSMVRYAQILAHTNAVLADPTKGIVVADAAGVVEPPDASVSLLKYEVMADGTLGPVRKT